MSNYPLKYNLLNPNEFAKKRSDDIFIYMLFLDLAQESNSDLPPKIFYVGQAQNIFKRFANHAQIQWYTGKFDKPVTALIAGVVQNKFASLAEKELVEQSLEAGYSLINSTYNFAQTATWSTAETLEYFSESSRDQSYLENWREKFLNPDLKVNDLATDSLTSVEFEREHIKENNWSNVSSAPLRRAPRGTIPSGILSILSDQNLNGYGLMQAFAEKTNGKLKPKSGSIYPALNQLVEDNSLELEPNGDYKLTDSGRKVLSRQTTQIDGFFESLSAEPDNKPNEMEIAFKKFMQAFQHVTDSGDEDQKAKVKEKLNTFRGEIYKILSE